MPEPNWEELRDAYGSAEDLPEVLAELEPDPRSPVWTELWGRVCHQYSTYSASPHVLPYLLSAASKWEPGNRAMPLALAGCIVSAPESNLEGYGPCVDQLRLLALETLTHGDTSRSDRIYLVQSALAFEGDRLWGHVLDNFNDGQFRGDCPSCRCELCFVLGQQGFLCSAVDHVLNPELPETEIRPSAPDALSGVGHRLYDLCTDSGDLTLGEWICYLFGTAACPQCNAPFDVATVVEAFERPALEQSR